MIYSSCRRARGRRGGWGWTVAAAAGRRCQPRRHSFVWPCAIGRRALWLFDRQTGLLLLWQRLFLLSCLPLATARMPVVLACFFFIMNIPSRCRQCEYRIVPREKCGRVAGAGRTPRTVAESRPPTTRPRWCGRGCRAGLLQAPHNTGRGAAHPDAPGGRQGRIVECLDLPRGTSLVGGPPPTPPPPPSSHDSGGQTPLWQCGGRRARRRLR